MAFFKSLNVKDFRFGEDKISPSDLGVGRLEALLLSLNDGIDKVDGTDEGLVFDIPDPNQIKKKNSHHMFTINQVGNFRSPLKVN